MPHDEFWVGRNPYLRGAELHDDDIPVVPDAPYTTRHDPNELFLPKFPTLVDPQSGVVQFPDAADNPISHGASTPESPESISENEAADDEDPVNGSGAASPSDNLDQWIRDTGSPYADDDAGLSIYAFLPEVGEPTGAAAPTVLDARVAADIAGTYPDARRDIFVAALRAHDPLCKKYRHLHLFAAAASAAPDERALDALARFWDEHLPLDAQPSGLGARASSATSERDDPALRHIVEMEHWLRQWFTLLYQPQLVALPTKEQERQLEQQPRRVRVGQPYLRPQPAPAPPPDLSALSQLADLAGRLEHMRLREITLRKLRWDAEAAAAAAARQRTFDTILADQRGRRPRQPAVHGPWHAKVFTNIERAYADMDYKYRSIVGSSRDSDKMLRAIVRADAVYQELPAETRIVAALLATEKLLERMFARRHVEREHLSQRVWVLDVAASARKPLKQLFPLHKAVTAFVEAEVRRIQHVAMHTYAYRYFQRTRIPKPWKELFLVMPCCDDDDDDDEEEIRAVRRVNEELGPLKNTAQQPLLLRPVAEQDMGFVAACDLCGDGYRRDQVVLKTWCNHLFHFMCIFRRWDSETSRGWDCPSCAHIAAAPGSMFGLRSPHSAPDAFAINRLKNQYRRVLRRQQRHPDRRLKTWMKEVRMAYYRHMRHNRDKRSFVGVGAYSWHPLPVEAMYQEEGMPRQHPQYRYDFDSDSLVPAYRGDGYPLTRVVVDQNGQAVLEETVVPGLGYLDSNVATNRTREQQFAADAPHIWPSADPFAPSSETLHGSAASVRFAPTEDHPERSTRESRKRVRFN